MESAASPNSLYRPTELHRFLNSLGTSPKKGLSQNFLIDGNILRKTVSAAQVAPGDLVLEVGPGPGALTEQLLAAGARVLAVEKDPLLADALYRLGKIGELTVYPQDIMAFPFEELLMPLLGPGQKAKLIANIPYHLTTPLLALLVQKRILFSSLTVMVQEEVARRMVASPHTREYSSFTLFLNFYSDSKISFKVGRRCFYPVPGVDSAVVQFNLKESPPVSDREAFFKMTRRAFEHRRKMLRSSLKELYPSIEAALMEVGLKPTARPEELSLEQFLLLFECLLRNSHLTHRERYLD